MIRWLLNTYFRRHGDWPLGLAALARKYGVPKRRRTLLRRILRRQDLLRHTVGDRTRYGVADVKATEEITLKQLDAFGVTFEELFDGKGIDTHTKVIA